MFSLPGTPVIRYGDEIGMGDDLDLPERNCARTPMQWSDEPHGGFTRSDKPVLPVISKGPFSYEHVNVAAQRRDPKSLLNWTERLIRMRKEAPEIGWGDCIALDTGNPGVLALRYDWRDNSVPIVHNRLQEPVEVHLHAGCGKEGDLLIDIADDASSQANEEGYHRLRMEAHAYNWFRVGGLDYLLRRTPLCNTSARRTGLAAIRMAGYQTPC